MLYFFHHYELPHVEHRQHHNTATRVPLIVGGHQLVAILHTPIRPFPHISLAVFASHNHDNRRLHEDISDNDTDDTAVDTDNAVAMPISTTDSSGNIRNRFYHNSDTLLRRPL